MTITKPPHGAPCNGCGYCCEEELCPLASMLFRRVEGPCPALQPDRDRRICGLMANPGQYAPVRAFVVGTKALSDAASVLIGVGVGCDAQTEDEPYNKAFGQRLRREFSRNADRVNRALIAWGFPPLPR
jgi:hypothetical protein